MSMPAETPAAPPRSLKSAVIEPLTSYFKRPDAIVCALFLIFYKFGDNLASSMWIPFMVDKGITRVEIGLLNKPLGTISVLAGVALGGAAIPRIGLGRALWIFGVVQALSSGFYGVSALADGARLASRHLRSRPKPAGGRARQAARRPTHRAGSSPRKRRVR